MLRPSKAASCRRTPHDNDFSVTVGLWISCTILGFVYFYVKAFIGYFVITWIRLSLPRIRIDHMLAFSWKFLTPLILVVLMVTAILVKLLEDTDKWVFTFVMLAANIFIGWIVILILKRVEATRPKRQKFEGRPVAMAPKPPASANS